MNKEDKQRVVGKIVSITADKFTVELLSGITNFNVNGFDDIHYFAQINSYVVIPYQFYYLIAEVANVKERDVNSPDSSPSEQFLSKAQSGKFIDVIPIGTLKPNRLNARQYDFQFGISVYPSLYADVLYIRELELDAIFNVADQYENICIVPDKHQELCDCNKKRYKTLSIGRSNVFPDYEVKVDIDKFFGSHSAILGNTGSGKSCTIAAMLQNLFRMKEYSATGSSFIILDVNGEYTQAFSKLTNNSDIDVISYVIDSNSNNTSNNRFILPHYLLTIDEWALLLHASEKTQLPILRNALGLACFFSTTTGIEEIKTHLLATCIMEVFRDESGSPSKKDRLHAILRKFFTSKINLQTPVPTSTGSRTIDQLLTVSYGEIPGSNSLQTFLESKDASTGQFIYFLSEFEMPSYSKGNNFTFDELIDSLDLAIFYEEAHGNKQIRDYCSSLITRAKNIKDRTEFEFLRQGNVDMSLYKQDVLGVYRTFASHFPHKRRQVVIIDLSSVEDEIVEIISCVLSRIVFEILKESTIRNNYPVNLILEEAHRYIGEDPSRSFLKATRIFESIAKEGRKFGLLLLISSQRPSELSRTVLSQCSNFIVHRIQNPEDLSHIRQITPHISEAILKHMPSIPTQQALIFGHAVNLPTTFKVNAADPLPRSDNNKVSENWFKPKNHIAKIEV